MKESKEENLIGTKINDYIITKYINSGSFGSVYEAKSEKDNTLVALKIPTTNSDKNGEKCILAEIKVYSELNDSDHSFTGISKMNKIYSKDSKIPIIVMDRLGDSLQTLLEKNIKFSLKNVILLSIQMLETIKFIHDHGYIHRDIKPENIVMDMTNENLY